jgi:hypothetical protein
MKRAESAVEKRSPSDPEEGDLEVGGRPRPWDVSGGPTLIGIEASTWRCG